MHGTVPPLLSRVADSVYWMARYIERAENIARFIGVNLNLHLDLPMEPTQQWQPLIDTSGDTDEFKERYGKATQDNVIEFLALRCGQHQLHRFLLARPAKTPAPSAKPSLRRCGRRSTACTWTCNPRRACRTANN